MIVHATRPEVRRASARSLPTVWGMTPIELHDHFWLSRGVQVVRQGEAAAVAPGARAFLLLDRRSLAIFETADNLRMLRRKRVSLLGLRLRDERDLGYREIVQSDEENRFVRLERVYRTSTGRRARVGLTTDRALAEQWRTAADAAKGWRALKRAVPRERRQSRVSTGYLYDRTIAGEVMQAVRDLVQIWRNPETSLPGVRRLRPDVWSADGVAVHPSSRFFGTVWIGAGRSSDSWTSVIGPAVLWDDPQALSAASQRHRRRADVAPIEPARQSSLEPLALPAPVAPASLFSHWQRVGRRSLASWILKRSFDVCFSLAALAVTLPFYPLVMLLIWLEDGRPFFFGHRREGLGGREFTCWKFRSMKKDAEAIKAELAAENMADGPQFFMEHDPRLTKVGRLLRKLQVDEWPQFFNVLLGDMSVVGPRPSPYKENQFCPAWREARLSVRPGITGLWQLKRSRAAGLDFQEWIRYDVEYVEHRSFLLDLEIILGSIGLVASLVFRKSAEKLNASTAPPPPASLVH